MNQTKWIYYTVGVGLLPVVLRLLAVLFCKEINEFVILNSPDIIFFGLVLCISNINEVEFIQKRNDNKRWITRTNGLSTLFIVFFTFLFALILVNEIQSNFFNTTTIKIAAIILSTTFFIFTLSVYHNLKAS
jgi:hypothetical protein